MIVSTTIDLSLLHNRLIANGIVLLGLQRTGNDVKRQLSDGSIADLPPEAQPIIDAIINEQKDNISARQSLVSAAQTAIGKTPINWTQAERAALLALLIWESGGLNGDTTLKPLSQWLRD